MTDLIRLRPNPDVITDAMVYDGTPASAATIVDWCGDNAWYREGELVVRTEDGDHDVTPGHWVLIDPRGLPYPVHPDVVAAKYDQVGEW